MFNSPEGLPEIPLDSLLLEQERRQLSRSLLSFCRAAFPILEPDAKLVENIAVRALVIHLQAVADSTLEPQNLVVNLPPGSLKSSILVMFEAWLLARDPRTKILCASYDYDDVAVRDSRKCRLLLESPWFQERWPLRLRADQNRKDAWETEAGGHRVCVPVGGGTGVRCDYLVLDDPNNISETDAKREQTTEWMFTTATSRVNLGGVKIVVQQRTHVLDISGEILKRKLPYTHLVLPAAFEPERKCVTAIWQDPRDREGELLSERYSDATLDELREHRGSFIFNALYQQRPSLATGNLLKRSWLKFHAGLPWERGRTLRKMSVEDAVMRFEDLPPLDHCALLSSTDTTWGRANDYVVTTIWAICREMFYLLEMHRGRFTLAETCKILLEADRRYRQMRCPINCHLIESTGNAVELQQTLSSYVRGMIPIPPRGSKIARFQAVLPLFESGKVVLPHPSLHPWVESELLAELLEFPQSEHDDCADSVSQALSEGDRRFGAAGGMVREIAALLR